MPADVTVVFTERLVEAGGLHFRYLEAGEGKAVVMLHRRDSATPSPLARLLSSQFRVLTFDVAENERSASSQRRITEAELARALAEAASAVGLKQFALVSGGAGTSLALRQVLDAPGQIEALVLISPEYIFAPAQANAGAPARDPELEGRLGEIAVPTLLMLGTEDQTVPADTGAMYAERLPSCYYVLVYDATHALEEQRPDSLFATVRDFLERREAFVVNRTSTLVNP